MYISYKLQRKSTLVYYFAKVPIYLRSALCRIQVMFYTLDPFEFWLYTWSSRLVDDICEERLIIYKYLNRLWPSPPRSHLTWPRPDSVRLIFDSTWPDQLNTSNHNQSSMLIYVACYVWWFHFLIIMDFGVNFWLHTFLFVKFECLQ